MVELRDILLAEHITVRISVRGRPSETLAEAFNRSWMEATC